jgi:hypothetical protein
MEALPSCVMCCIEAPAGIGIMGIMDSGIAICGGIAMGIIMGIIGMGICIGMLGKGIGAPGKPLIPINGIPGTAGPVGIRAVAPRGAGMDCATGIGAAFDSREGRGPDAGDTAGAGAF